MIINAGHDVDYEAKKILLNQGGSDDHALLLLSGIVKVIGRSTTGMTSILAIREAGDLIGEMAGIDRSERMATVVTCRDVRARRIRRTVLEELMQAHPVLALHIMKMINARLRHAEERYMDTISYNGRIRLSRVLVSLADDFGIMRGSRCEVDVHLTQTELGSMVGLRRRATETLLSELTKEGLIKCGHLTITVFDLARLRDISTSA